MIVSSDGTPEPTGNAGGMAEDTLWAHHKARFIEANGRMAGGVDCIIDGTADKAS